MYVKNIFTLSHKPLEVKSTIDIITTSHRVLGHNTVHGKILAGEKLVNLVNRELIIFLTIIHRYVVFGICTDCSLLAEFIPAKISYVR